MARALPPASFVREAPTNHQSEVPVTATGHCPVPVLPRSAKTSFPGREAAPPVPAWQRWPPAHGNKTGGRPLQQEQRFFGPFRPQKREEHIKGLWRPVAAVAPSVWRIRHGGGRSPPSPEACPQAVAAVPPPFQQSHRPTALTLGRVLTDGRVQRVMFLFRNGPFDAPAAHLSCGWEISHMYVSGRNHCRCRVLHVPCTSHFTAPNLLRSARG